MSVDKFILYPNESVKALFSNHANIRLGIIAQTQQHFDCKAQQVEEVRSDLHGRVGHGLGYRVKQGKFFLFPDNRTDNFFAFQWKERVSPTLMKSRWDSGPPET